MSEKLNKIVTNYSAELTPEEIENLSATLAPVIEACGVTGASYDGDGRYIGVDNTNYKISLLSDAASAVDQIYTNSGNWTDSYTTLTSNSSDWVDATTEYQTNSGTYLTTADSAEFYPMTGNPSGFMTEMFFATYNQTSYQDIKDAYNARKIVYCYVPNPTGNRMAFLAFVGTGDSGNFEFQYYRSLTPNKRPADVFGDELYTYIRDTRGWKSEKRYTCDVISAGDGLWGNYSAASDKGYFALHLSSEYIDAITSVSSKVNIPDTSLTNKYLVLRTDTNGDVSGWCDFQDQSYSKTEANGTFVATANIDTTTLSGDGKSVSTKLGVKTDVIATKDYVNSSFLPLSGGTVSGSVNFSVATGKNVLAVATAASLIGASRQTSENYGVNDTAIGTTWFGVGGNGMHQGFIKYTDGGDVGALDSNSMIQLNLKPSTNNFDSVQILQNGNSVGYLIPAVTATTTAGLTNDGILHIILES